MSVDAYELSAESAIQDRWLAEATLLDLDESSLESMKGFLADMEAHHEGTYMHSMRIGLLASRIGTLITELDDLPPGALFCAATTHDWGKLNVPVEILDKKTEPTEEEWAIIRRHPLDSYEALMRAGMPLEAGAVVLHHAFQPNPYPAPEEIPEPDPQLPEHLVRLQPLMGKVIALADFYDSSHRGDSGNLLSADEIKAKIYRDYADQSDLLDRIYGEGIFSSLID